MNPSGNEADGDSGFARAPWNARGHAIGILFAFLVGLVYFLPHALFILDCWPDYHYSFLGSGDERGYCSQIRESTEEGFRYSSPYFLEYKYVRVPPFSSTVGCTALVSRLLDIPIEQIPAVLDFVAPAAIFLILYSMLLLLTNAPWLSAVGASSVLLTSVFTLGIPNILLVGSMELLSRLGVVTTFRGFPIEDVIPNMTFPFARLINPQVNFLPFGAALVFATLLARHPRFVYVLGFSLCCGFLFYVAPFYWMYLLAGTGLFALFLLVRKDYRSFRYFLWALLGSILIGLPWLYATYKFFLGPQMKEFSDLSRFGLHDLSRVPFLAKAEILPILFFLILYPRKDRRYFFLASLLLGGFVCENQHLLTGRQFGLFKFVLYVNGPVVWIALFALVARFGQTKREWLMVRWLQDRPRGTTLACIAFLLTNGVATQILFYAAGTRRPLAAYEVSAERWKRYQAYYPEFEWLKQNATDQDVMLASDEVSTLIPCFTQLSVLVLHFAYSTVTMTERELLERWFTKFRFFELGPQEIRNYLDRHVLISTNTPSLWYMDPSWGKLSFFNPPQYQEILSRVSEEYSSFFEEDLLYYLKKYHVTMVWLSEFEEQEFAWKERGVDPEEKPWLERVYASPRAGIYRILYER